MQATTKPDKGMLHNSFQQTLRETRRQLGMTQAQVAEKMGVRQATYADMETGPNPPNLATIEKIAASLGVSPFELLNEKIPA